MTTVHHHHMLLGRLGRSSTKAGWCWTAPVWERDTEKYSAPPEVSAEWVHQHTLLVQMHQLTTTLFPNTDRCNDNTVKKSFRIGETWMKTDLSGHRVQCLCLGNGRGEWKCDRESGAHSKYLLKTFNKTQHLGIYKHCIDAFQPGLVGYRRGYCGIRPWAIQVSIQQRGNMPHRFWELLPRRTALDPDSGQQTDAVHLSGQWSQLSGVG